MLEALLIIITLGGLEIFLWWLDQTRQEEQQQTLDSILEELMELNDKTVDQSLDRDEDLICHPRGRARAA